MWNWIKYLPLEWRKRPIDCVPQGPCSGKTPSRIHIPIANSHLCFRAPRHRPRRKELRQKRLFPGDDALSDGIFQNYGAGLMGNEHWGGVTPFFRAWTFWGPWMTGAKAQLKMSVSIQGRYEKHAFSNTSFFNPKVFEMVIFHYLNDRYGHGQWDDGKPRHWGPVDWKVHSHLPIFCASCKVYKLDMDGKTPFRPDYLWFFPITNNRFVEVGFVQDIYSWNKEGKPDFDTTPVQRLQDAILDSMTLELSPEARADYEREKAECGDMTLTDHFPPLQWPTTASESEASKDGLRLRQA